MTIRRSKFRALLSGLALLGLLLNAPAGAEMPPVPVLPEMPGSPVGMLPAVGSTGGGEVGVAGATDGSVEMPDVTRQRDPFWPVGYTPKKRVIKPKGLAGSGAQKGSSVVEVAPEPVRVPVWDEARKRLDIRGISLIHDKNSRSPKYLALISGKLVEEGNVVSVKFDDRVYRWRVAGITAEGVSLQKLDIRGE